MNAGWGMINVSSNKPFLSLIVSGQIWTPPYGTWLSLVKQELADVVIASVCFMLPKDSDLASDWGVNVEPRYLQSHCTVPHPQMLIYVTGMNSVLQTVPS